MSILSWLVPKERIFFELLEKQSGNVLVAVNRLVELLEGNSIHHGLSEMAVLEKKGDECQKEIYHKLHASLITPFDREDIYHLSDALDDVLDRAGEIADNYETFEIHETQDYFFHMAKILGEDAFDLHEAIKRVGKNSTSLEYCGKILGKEDANQELFKKIKKEIYLKNDAKEILKEREILRAFAKAIKQCEFAATIIREIVLKND
ncbi:MAG: DUF47 family protein [Candidatus Micrarchaeota archaeon]